MTVRRALPLALVLPLGGCIFAIGSGPGEEEGTEKRLEALEKRLEALERKCDACTLEGAGLLKVMQGVKQDGEGRFVIVDSKTADKFVVEEEGEEEEADEMGEEMEGKK